MKVVISRIAFGARVNLLLPSADVALRAGEPFTVYAMTRSSSQELLAITANLDSSLTVRPSLTDSSVELDSTSPQPDEDFPYTVYVPPGTTVQFCRQGATDLSRFLYGDQLRVLSTVVVN